MTERDGTEGPAVPWRVVLVDARERLRAAGLDSADVDARRIVERASGIAGPHLALHLDDPATRRGAAHARSMVDRRTIGEPLQYVLSEWSFRALDLYLDPRVLIPRPETEVVVEEALRLVDDLADLVTERPLLAADLGTGSGAIALSLAAERPFVEVVATDVSADALAVARANLAGLGSPARRVRVTEGSWFDALPQGDLGRFRLIVSNPPYVGRDEVLPAEVSEWEPTSALVAGPRGSEILEALVRGAPAALGEPGGLVLELAPHQAGDLSALARRVGFGPVEVVADHAGRDRVLVARRG